LLGAAGELARGKRAVPLENPGTSRDREPTKHAVI
jgi:hypothetical protein